jgi:hypothetical protein
MLQFLRRSTCWRRSWHSVRAGPARADRVKRARYVIVVRPVHRGFDLHICEGKRTVVRTAQAACLTSVLEDGNCLARWYSVTHSRSALRVILR